MAYYTAKNSYKAMGTFYIQAWINSTLHFWQSKIEIYYGRHLLRYTAISLIYYCKNYYQLAQAHAIFLNTTGFKHPRAIQIEQMLPLSWQTAINSIFDYRITPYANKESNINSLIYYKNRSIFWRISLKLKFKNNIEFFEAFKSLSQI